jgi:hypothetical protein
MGLEYALVEPIANIEERLVLLVKEVEAWIYATVVSALIILTKYYR